MGIVLDIDWYYAITWFPTSLLITRRSLSTCTFDVRTVWLCQETLCNNCGYEAWFDHLPFQGGASFVDSFCKLCIVSIMLSCLFIAALRSPAGKGQPLGSPVCDVFFCFVTFPCGVLSHCIDS